MTSSAVFRFSPRQNQAHCINWQVWDEAIFNSAQADDKLIFLSLSPVWSVWSQRMDENAYSDPRVTAYLNEHYIPVRIDPDQRPDLNQRYNLGGWPSIGILVPQGHLLTGGAFLTAENLLALLKETDQTYHKNKARIVQKLGGQDTRRPEPPVAGNQDYMAISDNIFTAVQANYDPIDGGFSKEIKYPHPEIMEFLLKRLQETKDSHVEEMIIQTLGRMQSGAICDRTEGGFFRCARGLDWSQPYPEKLLVVNVNVLRNYLEAYQLIKNPTYLETIQGILDFILERLYDAERGYFYNAEYADSTYYQLTKEQRAAQPAVVFRDTIFYTNWNARTVSALVRSYAMTGEARYLAVAETVMQALERTCRDTASQLYFHFQSPDQRFFPTLLTDQEAVLNAQLDLYDITGNQEYARQAGLLLDKMEEYFYDRQEGGFFDRVRPIQGREQYCKPEKVLVENCRLVLPLLKLDFIANTVEYRKRVDQILAVSGRNYQALGMYAAPYANALELMLAAKVEFYIIINPDDKKTREITRVPKMRFIPGALTKVYQTAEKGIHRGALKFFYCQQTAGYVSINGRLSGPFTQQQNFIDILMKSGF